MVMQRYKSDYPNHVHQLLISASRHLYALKDGRVREQKKPMEVTLANVNTSDKTHLINLLIHDHFSGAFYAEVAFSSERLAPEQFLHRAWCEKDGYAFCGFPDILTVPETVYSQHPQLVDLVSQWGVTPIRIRSGFQAGVGVLKYWENELAFAISYRNLLDAEEVRRAAPALAVEICSRNGEKKQRLWTWRKNVTKVESPPQSFDEFFRGPAQS
jgi:hypothetical protein